MEKQAVISEEIILKAKKGDIDSFNIIYKYYYNKVYFVGMQFFYNEELAKDIVQEVFIKVYQKIGKLKETKAFHVWIHKIAYNECLSMVRKKKIKTVDFGEHHDMDDFTDTKDSPTLKKIDQNSINESIVESLETMSTPLKMVAFLRFYEDYKIEEIAEVLNVPKGTVNSRLSRIKEVLQVDLKRKGFKPETYRAFIAPGLLISSFKLLCSKYALSEASSTAIYKGVLNAKGLGEHVFFKKVFGTIAVATIILVSGIYYTSTQKLDSDDSMVQKKPVVTETKPKEPVVVPAAKFDVVEYNKNWTNQSIDLQITTTNSNYDQILVNGVDTRQIHENGSYTIQLWKDGRVLDERQIQVSNIDKESPTGTSYIDGDRYVLYLQDNLSGIHVAAITYYKNGVLSKDYTYDIDSNRIDVKGSSSDVDKFYISDYAGNVLEVDIK